MPTAVDVSWVKIRVGARPTAESIEGLGGMWRARPWYVSVQNVIWEIGRTDDARQWDFYVWVGDRRVPIVVGVTREGRRYLTTSETPDALLRLPGIGDQSLPAVPS